MKISSYTAEKPFYIVIRDGKVIIKSKIVLGRIVSTPDKVEWFDTEEQYKARIAELEPKK